MGDTQEIIDLFIMCGTQWRVGFDGPVGIDYSAVFSAAEVLGIDVTPALFKKIRSLEGYELERMASKRKGG